MGSLLAQKSNGDLTRAGSSARISLAVAAVHGGVANITALTALPLTSPTTIADGAHVWVESVRDYFVLRTSAATLVTGRIAASAVAGRLWFRCCIPDPSWAQQALWEINSGSSPENDGATAGTAIPWSELLRRLAGTSPVFTIPAGFTITCNIRANMPSTDPLVVWPVLLAGAKIIVNGIPTAAFTGTISAKTDILLPAAPATGALPTVTSTWNPTTHLNKLVYDATQNLHAWIAKDLSGTLIPGGGGTTYPAGTAKLCNWRSFGVTGEVDGNSTVSPSAPPAALSDAITVYDLITVAAVTVNPSNGVIGAGGVIFNKLNFTAAVPGVLRATSQICYQNCDFSGEQTLSGGFHGLHNCRFNITAPFPRDAYILYLAGGLVTGGFANALQAAGACVELVNYVLFQGSAVYASRQGIVRVRNVFFEDSAGGSGTLGCLIRVQGGAIVQCASGSAVRGNGNTVAVLGLDSTTRVLNGVGIAWATTWSIATTGHNGISLDAVTRNTARAIDPVTGLPGTARSTTFALLDTTYAGGGFEGFFKDFLSDVWAGK